jgi:signal peptidase
MTLEEINQAFLWEIKSDSSSGEPSSLREKTHNTAVDDRSMARGLSSQKNDFAPMPSVLVPVFTQAASSPPGAHRSAPDEVEAASALPPFRFTEPALKLTESTPVHTSSPISITTDTTTGAAPKSDPDSGYRAPEMSREIWLIDHHAAKPEPAGFDLDADDLADQSLREPPVSSAYVQPDATAQQPTVIPVRREATTPGKRRIQVISIVSDVFFYVAILIIFIQILTSDGTSGAPKMIFRYSFFTVVSESMQDEIPKGSFIVVRRTEPAQLSIGDNITYMRDSSTSVTHQIIDIYEDFQGGGSRGFQTKGVNNLNPDPGIVHESNVLGKVVFVIPVAGAIISYLNTNILLLVVIFVLCIILSFSLRGLFAKPRKDQMLEENVS